MLLSVALPADEELENAMENASYLLEKDLDLWHLQIMQRSGEKEGSLCIYSRFLFCKLFCRRYL